MSQQKHKSSHELMGTPRFTLAYLKECLEFERESGELMKGILEANKNLWDENRIKLITDIINQHRRNYKTITKQIENL